MKAIVTGISGQDGHFMTEILLAAGYEVLGLTSNSDKLFDVRSAWQNDKVVCEVLDYDVVGGINDVVQRFRPNLIFNFAAKATGHGMFDDPLKMLRLNGGFVLDILEAIRTIDPGIRFCQASSAEIFGHVTESPQSESTCFRPKSPYGSAKGYAHNMIGIYRNAHNLLASSAILYNHESNRRSPDFVTKKIARAAAAIKMGRQNELLLGSLEMQRDWGFAPEYTEAMYLMAISDEPTDYVIATGKLTTVRRVCEICFDHCGLDYRRYVKSDPRFKRSIETTNVCGNPEKIKKSLGWTAKKTIEQILIEMVDLEIKLHS